MLRTDQEYKEAVERIRQERARYAEQERVLTEQKLKPDEIKRVMDPLWSFHEQLVEEVRSYERLKRGEFGEVLDFRGFERLLIALRIYKGISQKDLAKRLGVDPSQVCRDEKNEYHGITIDRAARILEALGVELRTSVNPDRNTIPGRSLA